MTAVLRLANAPLVPIVVWLAGLAGFAILAVDGLFDGPNPVFVIVRVTAYVTVGSLAAVTVAFVAMLGLACGAMLTWLGEQINARLIVTAMCRSSWCIAAYVWFGVVLLIIDPPVALTAIEVAKPDVLEARIREIAAFEWMARLRYLAGAGFLVAAAWWLARSARPLNAVISVAFAVAALAAMTTALGMLAGDSPTV